MSRSELEGLDMKARTAAAGELAMLLAPVTATVLLVLETIWLVKPEED